MVSQDITGLIISNWIWLKVANLEEYGTWQGNKRLNSVFQKCEWSL